jgi:uncharacterized membrane protein
MECNPPPDEYESEKASNSYLMSVVALMVGLPFPLINLIATAIFFFGNRSSTFFVRWHCMQALLSQAIVLFINATGVYWTLSIIFGSNIISDSYLGYIITAILFNIAEFTATVYAAIATRKGKHVELWLFGPLTNVLVKA